MRRHLFLVFSLAALLRAEPPLSEDGPPARGPSARALLKVEPAYFSPNGDRKSDAAFFSLAADGAGPIIKWSVAIEDGRSRVVKRLTGRDGSPGLVEWTGLDDKGRRLAEGAYKARAAVWGRSSKMTSEPIAVTIDTSPPEASVLLSSTSFSPDDDLDDRIDISLAARDSSGLHHWALKIESQAEVSSIVFQSSGSFKDGRAGAVWNGRSLKGEPLASGVYSLYANVHDMAGNLLRLPPQKIALRVSNQVAIKKLMSSLGVLATADGYRLPLRNEQLFESSGGTPRLSASSENLRANIVYLVKALADHKVVLNASVGSEKTAAKRNEASTAMAWSLYSYLVRAGVNANRVEPRGSAGSYGKTPDVMEIRLIKPAALPGTQSSEEPFEGLSSGFEELPETSAPAP